MRYHLLAIGQLKRGFYKSGVDFYSKRLAAHAKIEVSEVKEGKGDADAVKKQESDALLKGASGYLVALDESGVELSSRQLADAISRLENRSHSQLSLLIGGAEGHSDALKAAVNECWSLSKMTLPHELARLVLLEQLYRAETIRAGHPYHRE